jgi:hypothetical protein
MAKALLRPNDELHVVTVVMSESSIAYGKKLTDNIVEADSTGQLKAVVRYDDQLDRFFSILFCTPQRRQSLQDDSVLMFRPVYTAGALQTSI